MHEENPSVNSNAVFILIICGPVWCIGHLGAQTKQFPLFPSTETDALACILSMHQEPDFIWQFKRQTLFFQLEANIILTVSASKKVGYFGVEGNSLTCKRSDSRLRLLRIYMIGQTE